MHAELETTRAASEAALAEAAAREAQCKRALNTRLAELLAEAGAALREARARAVLGDPTVSACRRRAGVCTLPMARARSARRICSGREDAQSGVRVIRHRWIGKLEARCERRQSADP